MSDDDTIRVQLARMEGKQDVTNERLETANQINNERHEAIKVHLNTIDGRLHAHGNRIGVLEAARHIGEGERKGFVASGKALMVLAGAVPVAAIAALLRMLGA